MSTGPGKYDDLATHVREASGAACVLVAVIGGNRGTGFSVQAIDGALDAEELAFVLRQVACELEKGGSA